MPIAATQHHPMGRAKIDYADRALAQRCWEMAGGQLHLAVKIFKRLSGGRCRRNLSEFMLTWGPRSSIQDLPRSGAPKKVSDEDMSRCVAELRKGMKVGPHYRPWRKLTWLLEAPTTKQVLTASRISPRQLLRNIKKAAGKIKCKKVHLKPHLPVRTRQARVRIAKLNAARPLWDFHRVVWLDWKTLKVEVKTGKAWLADGENDTISDRRVAPPKGQVVTLHFMAAVNWFTGALDIVWATSTTGLQHATPYLVSDIVLVAIALVHALVEPWGGAAACGRLGRIAQSICSHCGYARRQPATRAPTHACCQGNAASPEQSPELAPLD